MRGLLCLLIAWLADGVAAEAQTSCSCASCPIMLIFPDLEVLSPNARVFARLPAGTSRPTLTDDTGAPIEFALEPAGDPRGAGFWLTPLAPLPRGHYVLQVPGGGTAGRREFDVAEDALDSIPPSWDHLAVIAPVSAYCGDLDGLVLEWSAASAAPEPLTLEVEVWRGVELLGVAFPRSLRLDEVRPAAPFEVGTSAAAECFGTALVDGVMEGDELTIRARIWDAAGNVSEERSLTTTAIHLSARVQCERWCSISPSRAHRGVFASAFLLVLVTSLVVRRCRPGSYGL